MPSSTVWRIAAWSSPAATDNASSSGSKLISAASQKNAPRRRRVKSTRLLQEGLEAVFGNAYDEHPTEFDKIFDTFNSRKNFEVDAQLEGFGLAPEKPEGDEVAFDSVRQGFTPKYPNITYAKGFIITKEAMQDELYDQFVRRARSLAFSMRQTKEVEPAGRCRR